MGLSWIPLRRHVAKIDEILHVLWSDYYGAALFGDDVEVASLPHTRCRLEVVGDAESSHRDPNGLLPGQVIRYKGRRCFVDRFELPGGTTVALWCLVGFTLRILSDTVVPVPSEESVLDSVRSS